MSAFLKSFVVLVSLCAASAGSMWCDVSSDASGQYLVAVGDGCTQVYKSDDFGLTWTLTNAPLASKSTWWGSIYSDATGKNLMVGPLYEGSYKSENGWIYSNNRGETWATASYNDKPTTDIITGYDFSSDWTGEHIVSIAQFSASHRELVQSLDGGAKWTNIPVPSADGNSTVAVAGAAALSGDGKVIYTANDKHEIVVSHDSGATWTRGALQPKSDPSTGSWEHFVTDFTGQTLYATTYRGFYISTDFGATVTNIVQIPSNKYGINALTATPDGEYAYLVEQSSLWIYTKETGALVQNPLRWVVVDTWVGYSIDVSDDGRHIVLSVQQDGLYVSADFGVTWTHTKGAYN